MNRFKKYVPFWIKATITGWIVQRQLRRAARGREVTVAAWSSRLGRFARVTADCIMQESVIGERSYIGNGCTVIKCEIGKYCSIAPGSHLGLGSHPVAFGSTHPIFYLRQEEKGFDFADGEHFESFARTRIGNDVWIGTRALVKDGVTIGDGAVIGAGAVVTKDVPAYAIVAGVPAKVIRRRFDDETIAFLLRAKWWDRDEAWLRANWRSFHDVQTLKSALGRAGEAK